MTKRVFVAGHQGMVGSAIVRELSSRRDVTLVTATRDELDLESKSAVNEFFAENKIDEVYLAAARVGGIHANNTYPADFIYSNLSIQTNVIEAAHQHNIQSLLFLGSSCIYPRNAEQPMREKALLSGPLEPTNEAYAIAKIAGIKMCDAYRNQFGRDYRSVMPTNLYGVGDNYHAENSHVIPGLLRRFHEAKLSNAPTVRIWGTGKPKREFLYVDDMAKACLFVMALSQDVFDAAVDEQFRHLNVGYGSDVSIEELANEIAKVVGYNGQLIFDPLKPDGVPRKLLDTTLLNQLGWTPNIKLTEGLKMAYSDFCNNKSIRL